jgi:hypothetical protein
MKKFFLVATIIFCIACAAIVFELVRRAYFEPKGSPSHLRRIAAQINDRAPMDAGEMMEVTGAESSDTTLVVHYRLLNAFAANVDAPMQRKVREVLRGHACEKEALREVLDGGAALRYVLVDMNDAPILDTEILRWECGVVAIAPSSR